LTNQTIYIIGEARTTMDNAITKMFGNFYIAFEMELDKDKIVDVDCNATLSHSCTLFPKDAACW